MTQPSLGRFTGRLALFPLPNVVLFPGVGLPLHIFEPRYRAMMEDVLSTDRLIGMVLLREGWEQDYYGTPAVHQVGCIGSVEGEERLADGRWNLVLRGQARFRIEHELDSTHPYRLARVALLAEGPVQEGSDLVTARTNQLMMAVWRYLGQSDDARAAVSKLFGGELPLPRLVDRIAAALAIPAELKQTMLEMPAPLERLETLLATLHQAAEEAEQEDHEPADETAEPRPGSYN